MVDKVLIPLLKNNVYSVRFKRKISNMLTLSIKINNNSTSQSKILTRVFKNPNQGTGKLNTTILILLLHSICMFCTHCQLLVINISFSFKLGPDHLNFSETGILVGFCFSITYYIIGVMCQWL